MPNSNTPGAAVPRLLDRNTASRFNPFIGIHAGETMERCECAVSDLGYIISGAGQIGLDADISNIFRLFEAITIALRFEVESLTIGGQS